MPREEPVSKERRWSSESGDLYVSGPRRTGGNPGCTAARRSTLALHTEVIRMSRSAAWPELMGVVQIPETGAARRRFFFLGWGGGGRVRHGVTDGTKELGNYRREQSKTFAFLRTLRASVVSLFRQRQAQGAK